MKWDFLGSGCGQPENVCSGLTIFSPQTFLMWGNALKKYAEKKPEKPNSTHNIMWKRDTTHSPCILKCISVCVLLATSCLLREEKKKSVGPNPVVNSGGSCGWIFCVILFSQDQPVKQCVWSTSCSEQTNLESIRPCVYGLLWGAFEGNHSRPEKFCYTTETLALSVVVRSD